MELLRDVLLDATLDTLKMVPFLLVAFLIIEAVEHHSWKYQSQIMLKIGKGGPALGAVLGCVPQCGFSVMAANLYAGGVLSLGTLLAVFIATSDEAVLILLGHPGYGQEMLQLMLVKVGIGVIAGYVVDFFTRGHHEDGKYVEEMCQDCGCKNQHGILKPALYHTMKIAAFIFICNAVLTLIIELIGMESLTAALLGDSVFQPFIAAIIGLIPNCASSVILTELYIKGAMSFPSVIAGLCTGAGVGLLILFKINKNRKENLKILGLLYGIAVVAGVALELVLG